MTLRLVLVSLVAGLGIGIPSPSDIEGWVASSRSWANACLAELGVNRIDGNALTAADDPRQPEASLPADPASITPPQSTATAVAASSEETPTASFEPIEVDERMYVGLAYDLNYFGEGLGMLPKVAAPVATPPSAVRPDELVELAIARHGAAVSRLVGRLGSELNAIAAREVADKSFLAMEAAPDLYFAGSEESAVADSAFAAMERSEALYFAESEDDSIAPPAPAIASEPELPALPDDPFAPTETVEPPVEAIAMTTDPAPAPIRRGAVTRAVRLTGQAMAAWVNVFSETTLASVSPDSKIQ